jgi:hypothetical protein
MPSPEGQHLSEDPEASKAKYARQNLGLPETATDEELAAALENKNKSEAERTSKPGDHKPRIRENEHGVPLYILETYHLPMDATREEVDKAFDRQEYLMDLTSYDGVVSLMRSSASTEEWNANCNKVKSANNGEYPDFWFKIIDQPDIRKF